ncbi:MAG TPA: phosphate ABC transporter permease subunit PstC [Candidatus Manganitrophaceae bacterium]|nr:phosphate ABC transporter permease subunit PstC [Candidatus Manganitrophaceae bacterium]
MGKSNISSFPSLISDRPGLRWADRIFRATMLIVALSVLLITAIIAFELYRGSRLSIAKFGWAFLWNSTWDPVAEEFGALPFIYGTLVTSAISLLIAIPVGLGVAIFLSELAPRWLSDPVTFLVELLAAIPSVIYGLIGIFVLVPWMRNVLEPLLSGAFGFLPLFRGAPYGVGMLTAGILLAIMVIPFIVSVSREVLLAVPRSQREAILSLGATRWEMVRIAILPYARSGILGSVFLALARALGETMAVTMVIGNRPEVSASLFDPGYTMASVIANEFTEATSDLYVSALVEVGLVLFAVTIIVNALARLLIYSLSEKRAGVRT